MILKVICRLLMFYLLQGLLIKGLHGQCSTPLVNLAVYEGTQNTMMICNRQTTVSYIVKPASDPLGTYQITTNSDVVDPTLQYLYSANKTGLLIKIAQGNAPARPSNETAISTSGLYILNPTSTNKTGAKLVVVRGPPTCSCTPFNSTTLNLTCSLEYSDVDNYNPISAVMKWLTSDNVVVKTETPVRTVIDGSYVLSTSVFVVNESDTSTYKCNVQFRKPNVQLVYIAQNAPTFFASCSAQCSKCSKTNLKNLAVYNGDENMLMNLPADPNIVSWSIIPTSDEGGAVWITDYGGSRNPDYENLFYPNQSGLVVSKAIWVPPSGSIATSGLYIAGCTSDDYRSGAKIVVVDNSPDCSSSSSLSNTIELTCTIRYADADIHPILANMTWMNGNNVYTSDTPQRTRFDYIKCQSTSTITVDASDYGRFTCVVNFNAPTEIQYAWIATNAPDFSASCSVEVNLPCVNNLKNLAVYNGDKNMLMNLTADPNIVSWAIITTSDEFAPIQITDYGGGRNTNYEDLFYPNESGLVVPNAIMVPPSGSIATSGLYFAGCTSDSYRSGAKLVIVEKSPNCVRSPSSTLPYTVELTCTIIYADADVHPILANMTWMNGNDVYSSDTPQRVRFDYIKQKSTSTITLDASYSGNFTCVVHFNAPTQVQYPWIATNAPDFSVSCSVELYQPCVSNLRNAAVYKGDKNILMNLTADPYIVKWSMFPTSDGFGLVWITDYGGNRNPDYESLFYPNQSGLVILEATTEPNQNSNSVSTAGLYVAECLYDDNRTAAKLVVVSNGPECYLNTSSPTEVMLSCSIFYADITLHPISASMTWMMGDEVYTSDTPQRTRVGFLYASTSTITLDASDLGNFTCVVHFNAPTEIQDPWIATNAPNFSASCSVAG